MHGHMNVKFVAVLSKEICLQYIHLEARRITGEDNHNKINECNIIIVPTI